MTVIIIVLVLITILSIVFFNQIVSEENMVKNAFSTVDVVLKKRYDIVPSLVEIVKKSFEHESEVLEKVTSIRTEAMNTTDANLAVETDNKFDSALKSVFVVAENYPDLKASHNFLALQEELLMIENELLAARRTYNAAVTEYNTTIQSFPTNIMAKMMKKMPKKLFVVNDDVRNAINLKI
jgi:LemA protein